LEIPLRNRFDSRGASPACNSARLMILEFANIFGLAMHFGITAGQIRDNIYAYPTFSSDITHMIGHSRR
jgi:pyruvate/2-oxoglutarate dehydrogenase complex dihydrolipoamide dehydrogenase (E3) component